MGQLKLPGTFPRKPPLATWARPSSLPNPLTHVQLRVRRCVTRSMGGFGIMGVSVACRESAPSNARLPVHITPSSPAQLPAPAGLAGVRDGTYPDVALCVNSPPGHRITGEATPKSRQDSGAVLRARFLTSREDSLASTPPTRIRRDRADWLCFEPQNPRRHPITAAVLSASTGAVVTGVSWSVAVSGSTSPVPRSTPD